MAALNVGFEMGKMGTWESGLVQDNYYMLKLNVSVDDTWFIRSKYQ